MLTLLLGAALALAGPTPTSTPETPALQTGATLTAPALTALGGEAVALPDPQGRYAVLELVRSVDW